VQVRATHVDAGELGQDVRVGMAVVVALADPDQGHGRCHRRQEARRVRRAAVVRHLEHPRPQQVRTAQQPLLGDHLGVAGQQDGAVAAIDPQDERVVVEAGAVEAVRRRPQHLDDGRAEREAVPGPRGHDRHAAAARRGMGLDRRADGSGRIQGHRPDQERTHPSALQHGRQPAAVVVVGMGQHDHVQAADAAPPQVGPGGSGLGAAVHEHPCRPPVAVGRLQQDGVALTDVEQRDGQRSRGRGLPQGGRGGQGHRDSHTGQGRGGQARVTRTGDQGDQGEQQRRRRQRRGGEPGRPREGLGRPADDRETGGGQERQDGGPADGDDRDQGDQQPDELGQRGGGGRQKVGRQRTRRHATEDEHEDGCRARLGAQRRGGHHAQRSGSRQPRLEQRSHDQHPCRGEHRQREARLPGEQRVGEQQAHHRPRQDVAGIEGAAQQPGDEHGGGHDARAQHRRLPPDQQDEPDQGRQADPSPRPRPRPEPSDDPQHRGEQQRNVAAGDDHEVGQTGIVEALPVRRVDAPQVPGDQAGEQGRQGRRQP
jgi:hypothetical protein